MTMNAKLLALSAVAGLFTTSVSAADLTASYSEPPAYNEPAPAGWNGAYAGIHAGSASPKLNPFASGKGLAVGGQAGYNAEVGGAVVGGEVEASYLGDTKVRVNGGKLLERHRLAAKGKVGMPLDQTLVYGTAGLAMTNFRDNNGVSGPDGWKLGYLAGVGIEQKLTSNISAKVEYNYVMTNGVRSFSGGTSSKRDIHDHTVKVGLNYNF
jgi:outer membrane immunogenic protein